MLKLLVLSLFVSLGVGAQNMDPVPKFEVRILEHTSKLESYDWSPIYSPLILGSVCGSSQREMCQTQSFAENYVKNVKNLKRGMLLPENADYQAITQSVWVSKNENLSVDDVWKTLMSYLKLQRAMIDLRDFLGESASDSRTTVFRGGVYPHLSATASNFSVFHKILGFQEGLKISGQEPVLKVQLNRSKTILRKAFEPFREQLKQVQLDMTQPNVQTENMDQLRVRQMFSLARIFDVIKMNLNTYVLDELSVLESIDSYESLPAHFYLYALFLKENQKRVIQTLDPTHLKLLFDLVLLPDFVRYALDDSNFQTTPVELTEPSKELVRLVQRELMGTLATYKKVVEMGVAQ